MKKRIFALLAVVVLLISFALASGCSGTMKMLMGRWKLATVGDGSGGNQQDYWLPVSIDIYPDGTIDMLDSPFGKWTMDRNTFTFKDNDGTMDVTGSFKLEYNATDSAGNTTPKLTVYMDSYDASYVLQKVYDLDTLEKVKASAAAASAAATQAPAETEAPASAEATATSGS